MIELSALAIFFVAFLTIWIFFWVGYFVADALEDKVH
jgi:hypothetical protein